MNEQENKTWSEKELEKLGFLIGDNVTIGNMEYLDIREYSGIIKSVKSIEHGNNSTRVILVSLLLDEKSFFTVFNETKDYKEIEIPLPVFKFIIRKFGEEAEMPKLHN